MRLLILLSTLLLLSCGSYTPRNAELTVTYEGEIVHKAHPANSKWVTEEEFRSQLNDTETKYIIFGADWCDSCHRLYRALREGGYLHRVMFLDIGQPWAGKIAEVFGMSGLPTLFVVNEGQIKLERFGVARIVVYLVANVSP